MSVNNPLRVLIVHNRYLHAGGEDSVVASESDLLRQHGHDVRLYTRDNAEVAAMGKLSLLRLALWSRRTTRDMARELADFRPHVVHVHNSFPLISGSVYWACAKHGVPVVQTIHNFRLLCLQAMFLRQGVVCEDCLGHSPWRGVLRGCYQGSRATSAVAGLALQTHRALGTYRKHIGLYVALNDFCKAKLIEGGLPGDRVRIKPNFVSPLPVGGGRREGNPLFVGRLSEEKGLSVLAAAALSLSQGIVDIVGSGPEESEVSGNPRFRMLGAQPPESVYELLRNAPFLIMPSIWYENMPRTLVEAYACGTPVIASRLGALADLVDEGRTGLLFEPGSAADLAEKVEWALAHPDEVRSMGGAAREVYEERYTPEANYRMLADIYAEAIAGRRDGTFGV